jgi:DNA-binding NarL/FixJ family response regulator
VLKLLATGMTYNDTAAQLFISHRTVQNHVQDTPGKLQMHNRVELVRYAIGTGLHRD